MHKPNKDLLKLMKQAERKASLGKPPTGMLSESMNIDQLEDTLKEAVVVKTVGEMIAAARAQRELSARQVAESIKVSHPRVLAVEKTELDIEVKTLVHYAEALGYDVQLSFKPKEGGQEITANLTLTAFNE